jgi:hypothetical protein
MGRPANTVERIFDLYVTPVASGCWEWSGKVAKNGYGHTKVGGEFRLAHRAFYEGMKGPIAEGMTIDHLCRNRSCVNPAHLEPVSRGENVLRSPATRAAINLAKTHCVRGHPLSGPNLYLRPDRPGHRHCRACAKAASRKMGA